MNHGHVKPNADGSKARCGGPGICAQCSIEAQQAKMEEQALEKSVPCTAIQALKRLEKNDMTNEEKTLEDIAFSAWINAWQPYSSIEGEQENHKARWRAVVSAVISEWQRRNADALAEMIIKAAVELLRQK